MADLLVAVLQPGALITLLILLGAIVMFVGGWLAPELTGLLAASLLIVTGVLKPSEAMEGFGSPSLITLMGLFALSSGLFRSGGLDRLRALIGSDAVRSPKRMIAVMVAAVGPVSAFVPNTPIVASLLPVIEGWCQRRRISPSKVLLPLSFATVLGGTLTLLGSSVNLLASEVSSKLAAHLTGKQVHGTAQQREGATEHGGKGQGQQHLGGGDAAALAPALNHRQQAGHDRRVGHKGRHGAHCRNHHRNHPLGAAHRIRADQGTQTIQTATAKETRGEGKQPHQGDQGRATEALHGLRRLEHAGDDQQRCRQQTGELGRKPAAHKHHDRPEQDQQGDQRSGLEHGNKEIRHGRATQPRSIQRCSDRIYEVIDPAGSPQAQDAGILDFRARYRCLDDRLIAALTSPIGVQCENHVWPAGLDGAGGCAIQRRAPAGGRDCCQAGHP